MKLVENIRQSRRDFKGKYECEFCKDVYTDKNMDSYDDDYFYKSVIPNKKCKKCDKSTISENGKVDKITPKYPEHLQL